MSKVSHLALFAAAAVMTGFAAQANAVVSTTYNVTSLNSTGNSGFTYDTDVAAPSVTNNGFYASGTAGQYNTVRITPDAIGLTGLTLGDISSITYDTQQLGGSMDWQVKVYTTDQNGPASSWYGVRLNYGLNDGTPHDWTTFSRDSSTFNNWITDGSTSGYTIGHTYLLQNEPAGYNGLLAAAANQQVLWIDIGDGAATGGTAFDGYLNNIDINTSLGNASVVATPEPASLGLLAVGGIALLTKRRRKA